MKRFVAHILADWKLVILPALLKWGIWGVGAVAVLDSSSIPVPMDAILALYVWNDKPHFWIYCLMAAAGSAIGGLLPYGLGRAGGELFLLKRVDRARFERLRDRFERQEFLAVMIPSMMPPPTPWKMFIFASGVFEMRVPYFLLAVFAGRMVRWLALSLLVLKLGPGAVDLVARHALVVVPIVGALAVIGFAWWWIRKKRQGKLLAD
ncbi:MAG: VTT domain-containing protein [Terracidiphilus sp.]|nr:VTT domain-containing protein [Terracidiphilus sp.]MDR3797558.1 VTT domain-containing protein [Terracidiphilus sp.]